MTSQSISVEWDTMEKLLKNGTTEFKTESRIRRRDFDEETLDKGATPPAKEDGWQIEKELKTKTKYRKKKAGAKALEDRAWRFAEQLGVDYLNEGQKFNLTFGKNETHKKQIDVFAVDNAHKIIILIECKQSETKKNTNLKTSLNETIHIKDTYTSQLGGYRYKPIFIYFTQNLTWSPSDSQLAKENDIYVIDDKNIRYFETLVKNLGAAARSQLYGEVLKQNSKIKGHEPVKIPAIETTVKLRGNTNKKIYNFIVRASDLEKIAFVNHRGLREATGKNLYQRMIKKNRLRDISNFVESGGQFVTNILVNFQKQPRFDKLPKNSQSKNSLAGEKTITFGSLTLPDEYRSAILIDGQHRLFGCASRDVTSNTPLMVTAFDQLDKEEEIDMFVTINSKQQKIPPSLITGLKANYINEQDATKALEAMASEIIDQLANSPKGPFLGRFAPQDGTPKTTNENLMFTGIANSLKDSKLIGSVSKDDTTEPHPGLLNSSDRQVTVTRAVAVLNTYFSALRDANKEAWNLGDEGHICTNPAIGAHIRLIKELLAYIDNEIWSVVGKSPTAISRRLNDLQAPIIEFIRNKTPDSLRKEFNVGYGAGAQTEYKKKLKKQVRKKIADFK